MRCGEQRSTERVIASRSFCVIAIIICKTEVISCNLFVDEGICRDPHQTSQYAWKVGHQNPVPLVGRRFAHQRFADSCESICKTKKTSIFEALGQIRANGVFPPIRIQIRVIRVQSSLLSIFWKVDSQKEAFFFFERESIRANGPLRSSEGRCRLSESLIGTFEQGNICLVRK